MSQKKLSTPWSAAVRRRFVTRSAARPAHNKAAPRRRTPKSLVLVSFVLLLCPVARADVSRQQAQKAISRAAGFNLPSKSVHVSSVNMTAADTAEVNAELQLVFRLVQRTDGVWSVREIRTGQDLWEDIGTIASAAKFEIPRPECGSGSSELTASRTRCLIANVFGIALPSDAVRIKESSTFGLPIGTETSAIAVAFIRADFRLHKDSSGWAVNAFKSGNREWINVSGITDSMNAMKRAQATDEMRKIASALESYRKDRGYYVSSDKQSVLIDHLSPHYLSKVLRLDPWHHPYRYQGEGQHFTLRSSGPDGKPDTPDDLTLSDSSR